MPVTIGTLTSNVNVTDAGGTMTDEMIERIVKLAAARMKEDLRSEEDARQRAEVRERRSEPGLY
jgi:hypothetical protein